jgi:hypothetical protein
VDVKQHGIKRVCSHDLKGSSAGGGIQGYECVEFQQLSQALTMRGIVVYDENG